MDLVFFGIQGSGKGTQAKKLAAEYEYEIFEAGGELRMIAASNTPLGETVKSYIDVGKLVPHEIIMEVVKKAILARPLVQKLLFDGMPRDLDQMRDFDAIMQEVGRPFRCIHFTLDPEVGVQRILGRAKIEGRADDLDEAAIRRRMQLFVEKTLPVVERFKAQRKVTEINGSRSIDEVYATLRNVAVSDLH